MSLRPAPPEAICFGLDRALDEQSLVAYVQRVARPALIERLAARMSDEEMEHLVAHLGRLLKRHLSHAEYHQLFLGDDPV